ncbi:MAG: type II toxin-antitoxin system RelB/DinJ family antitoxin [Lachnospiraceae bacterium]|nr:type II toxin-antitoxin system RelB/DinJ family antitoxin [Lachnospiraceae bacterium]
MARTANVFARVEPEIKEQAESILDQLGIPMSNAVGMFLRQIVIHRGIPFEIKLPSKHPLVMGELSKEQFDAELLKGMNEIENGKVFSADDVESEMRKMYSV